MGIDLGQRGKKPGQAQPNMNVTPLVDVVLVLLIIFMVIAPLLAKQFWLNLPNKVDSSQPHDPSEKDRPIVILVTNSGEIMMNGEAVPTSAFSTKLHRVLAARLERTIFFDAEDDTEFYKAAEVLDLARAGGAATIAVLTAPIASHAAAGRP
jgi:biopolymer transport protein TolR